MIKTALMVAGLAVFVGASTACFGLFSGGRDAADPPAADEACAGLTGQAKIDCERRNAPR